MAEAATDLGTSMDHPLTGVPPSWASSWGQDAYGVFAAFEIGGVEQRMRWIPEGRWLLGSPSDEPGRYHDEQQLDVELPRFWMADVPCTQALYQAVTGENPSEFQHSQRPVENVSWIDAMEMIETLNRKIPGLEVRLPFEAEWEAACRAGTTTATYAGPIEILGERNAPVLDRIAWYGGNSGVDYDLGEHYDSSGWDEKQFPHDRAGTRIVGLKQPNPWGLYDTLGNVYEWCADASKGRMVPPLPQIDDDRGSESPAGRVFRGGRWYWNARHCRAAYRLARDPGLRDVGVGFRLSRGQD